MFSRILTEYGDFLCKSLYSLQMRENTDQKNFVFEQFLRSASSGVNFEVNIVQIN